MELKTERAKRLQQTIEWARKLRALLQPLLDAHGDRVHFRPSSQGIAMVGLLHEWPQRGKRITNLDRFVREFEVEFAASCRDIPHGRVTGEKALQSFLIRESYKNGRRMAPIEAASKRTNEPVELVFVTDEIPLPVEGGKMVCDVLAIRRDGGRSTPVLLELKDSRLQTRLVEQVEGYAALVDENPELFAEFYGALLGKEVRFDGPTEKWIVWPEAGDTRDPREAELRERGIRWSGIGKWAGCTG